MPILPEEVKKTQKQPTQHKQNQPNKYISEVFRLLKKPALGLEHEEDVTGAGGVGGMSPGQGQRDRGTAEAT